MCCVCFAVVKPGMKYRECGDVIQRHAQANGFSVVRTYCGHGIHRLVELLVTLSFKVPIDMRFRWRSQITWLIRIGVSRTWNNYCFWFFIFGLNNNKAAILTFKCPCALTETNYFYRCFESEELHLGGSTNLSKWTTHIVSVDSTSRMLDYCLS